jgi:hypothetical protein
MRGASDFQQHGEWGAKLAQEGRRQDEAGMPQHAPEVGGTSVGTGRMKTRSPRETVAECPIARVGEVACGPRLFALDDAKEDTKKVSCWN